MNVSVLKVTFSFNEKEDVLYPVILHQGGESILVDCGYAGSMPLIEDVAQKQGFSLQNLTGIIITHHDIDHIGGLFEIKEKYPALKTYASALDEKYISGKEKSLRLKQAEALYPSLPEDQKPGARHFQELLKTVKAVKIDQTFSEDEVPDYFPGIQIINTPGHMPGHISIYLKTSKTLIAADAVVIENGELELANPGFTLDLAAAVESIKKLQQLDIKRVICYHGGILEKDIQQQLSKLVAKYT